LQDQGVETVIVEHPLARKKGAAFYGRLALNLLSPLPYSVASHRSAPMREVVSRFAAANKVDVWQFEWPPYMASLQPPEAGRKVVIAHNVDTLIWQRFYETETRPLRRLFLRQQWRKFERLRAAGVPGGGLGWSRSARTTPASSATSSVCRTSRWSITASTVLITRRSRRGATRTASCSWGALDWRPNLDAVNLLLDHIFPRWRGS